MPLSRVQICLKRISLTRRLSRGPIVQRREKQLKLGKMKA